MSSCLSLPADGCSTARCSLFSWMPWPWAVGSVIFWCLGSPCGPFTGIASGMITVTVTFFWMEHVSQAYLIPLFFPDGGVSRVDGTVSVGLRMRLAALIIAVSLVPLIYIHLTIRHFKNIHESTGVDINMLMQRMEKTIAVESVLFVIIAVLLSTLVLRTLKRSPGRIDSGHGTRKER